VLCLALAEQLSDQLPTNVESAMLSQGYVVRAHMAFGPSGSARIAVLKDGLQVAECNIPAPADFMPLNYESATRPNLMLRPVREGVWVDMVFEEGTGVYEYKRIRSFLATRRGITDKGQFEFSGQGGFVRLNDGRVVLWDYDYQPEKESHQGPHRYFVSLLKNEGGVWHVESQRRTQKFYAPAESPLAEFSDSRPDWGEPVTSQWQHEAVRWISAPNRERPPLRRAFPSRP
jgi:hypothetical protein